jgi:mRNA-degrading endonuclease toxin of MazEF toxin-antitoxin module
MTAFHQWDVVKVRLRPDDRDEHYCVVISADEFCADERKPLVNVLTGSTRRPAATADPHEVTLNGADGLERSTLFNCGHFHQINRLKITRVTGRVTPERRRQIGRRIVATYRLPL